MSWSSEVVDLRSGRGKGSAGEGAVMRGDPGCCGRVARVDCYCVGCALGVGVFGYHLREGEAGCEGWCYRSAD